MRHTIYLRKLASLLLMGAMALLFTWGRQVTGQTQGPISSQELVHLLTVLQNQPEKKEEIVEEIRRRGINFELTSGLRSVIATKSRDDELVRRTIEEAARRHVNPVVATLPPAAEGDRVLEQSRISTIEATKAMPDFVVKQIVTRSHALGTTKNWIVEDHLTVAASYREDEGEKYRLLAVNGLPTGVDGHERSNDEQAHGASSTGEFVSMLAQIFSPETRTVFHMVDTDTLRGRHAIVYEFEVKKEDSRQTLKFGQDETSSEQVTVTGYHGRIWVDRENYRVLRIEEFSQEIPPGFPITAAASAVDYGWVSIAGRQYLLPSEADIELTSQVGSRVIQSRNQIRFRNYQKYGAEVKILEDDEIEDKSPKQ